jgi:hypothetical protein
MIPDRGQMKWLEKYVTSLSTTNSTWTLVLNPGLCFEDPATKAWAKRPKPCRDKLKNALDFKTLFAFHSVRRPNSKNGLFFMWDLLHSVWHQNRILHTRTTYIFLFNYTPHLVTIRYRYIRLIWSKSSKGLLFHLNPITEVGCKGSIVLDNHVSCFKAFVTSVLGWGVGLVSSSESFNPRLSPETQWKSTCWGLQRSSGHYGRSRFLFLPETETWHPSRRPVTTLTEPCHVNYKHGFRQPQVHTQENIKKKKAKVEGGYCLTWLR